MWHTQRGSTEFISPCVAVFGDGVITVVESTIVVTRALFWENTAIILRRTEQTWQTVVNIQIQLIRQRNISLVTLRLKDVSFFLFFILITMTWTLLIPHWGNRVNSRSAETGCPLEAPSMWFLWSSNPRTSVCNSWCVSKCNDLTMEPFDSHYTMVPLLLVSSDSPVLEQILQNKYLH